MRRSMVEKLILSQRGGNIKSIKHIAIDKNLFNYIDNIRALVNNKLNTNIPHDKFVKDYTGIITKNFHDGILEHVTVSEIYNDITGNKKAVEEHNEWAHENNDGWTA